MEIKRLTVNHAKDVEQLIDKTNIKSNQHNNSNSGFLLYNYGVENYKLRLKENNMFSFGCFEDDALVGCVLSYPITFLKKNPTFTDHESNVFKELCELNNNKIVWGEQIAILPNKRRNLYGKLLMKETYRTMKKEGYTNFSCMVSLYPNLNNAGIHFLFSEKHFSIYKTIKDNNTIWALFLSNTKIVV